MSRVALGSVLATLTVALGAIVVVSCSKSAGSKEGRPANAAGPQEVIAVPGTIPPAGAAKGANDEAFKLKPDEGELSIEVPPDAAAGKETIARVMVTPSPKYKINFEFSTILSLQPADGVELAKAELKAGGMAQVQGDAEKFEEKKLAFAVKLTPKTSGSHTVNGTFKFAVCDKDTCLAKKETIAIKVAAK